MDIKIPYITEIFLAVAVVLCALLLTKGLVRGQALMTAHKSQGYRLTMKGFTKLIVYESIVVLYYLAFGIVTLKYVDIGFWAGLVALFLGLEGLVVLSMQWMLSPFRVILNESAISLITNEVILVSWRDIQKIDSRQNDVHLIRKNGSPVLIDLEWLSKEDQIDFINRINEIARKKNIFCSIDCEGEYKDFTEMAARPIYNE